METPRLLPMVLLCQALSLAACSSVQPARLAVGQDAAAVRAAMGEPTGRYALAHGAQRLEYAQGPFGKATWMVDLGADGRVTAAVQVLNADNFSQVHEGMHQDEVLRLMGQPGERQGAYQGRTIWSWRFDNPFCLWAQVVFSAEGRALGGVAQSSDPLCQRNPPDRLSLLLR